MHVISLVHDEDEASHVNDLAPLVESVQIARVPRRRNLVKSLVALPTSRPTTHTMLDAPSLPGAVKTTVSQHKPDVVLAYCSGMAPLALMPPLSAYPFVLDMVDVDSSKWRDLSLVSPPPLSWVYRREARVLGAFERLASERATATMVVTAREQETLRSLTPSARIEVVPNGVDVVKLKRPSPAQPSANVVFCGVMNYAPNEHAALWLGREIWPLVRASRPDATLTIVGSSPTAAVQALASTTAGIVVTGSVPDVRPFLWNAAVAAAPILTARGIQNKVLEAVAAGLPTVVTPNIAAALPDQIMPAVVTASSAGELASAIVRLLALTPEARETMTAQADVASLAWDRQLAPIEGLLADAQRTPRPPEGRP